MVATPQRELLLERIVDDPAPMRVQLMRITMPPGMLSGAHVHNGPVFGVIEAGSALLRIPGEEPRKLAAGAVFHEPSGSVVDGFDALEDGVRFTVTLLTPIDVAPAITEVPTGS